MLLFCCSGDHHAGAVSSGKWDLGTDYNPQGQAGSGRFSTNPVLWGWAARRLGKDLGGNHPELIAGIACWFHGDGNFGDHNIPFCSFFDSGSSQIELRYDIAGSAFRVYRGNGTTLLATIPYTFNTSAYVYVEFRAKIDNSAGEWELRVDGVTLDSATGVDTQTSGNAYANILWLGEITNNASHDLYYDDLYVLETAGGGEDDFLGDVRVECLFPNGNGATNDWDGSDGNSVDNYLLVDETAPNGDTDYVESTSVADRDLYEYGNLATASGTVYGVQILPSAKKTDTGARSIASVARLTGGTDEVGADLPLGTAYAYRIEGVREEKPGGGAWTIADVNAAQFGTEVTV
jgi:hypothetical protein